jgi:glycine betaine/proline transport system substrate-binding protein
MLQKIHHLWRMLPAILLLGMLLSFTTAAQAADGQALRIGWIAWLDAEAVTNIAAQIIEQKLGCKVELAMTDIGLQYQGVAKGQLDVMRSSLGDACPSQQKTFIH